MVGSISFQSNISMVLIFIIIILVCVYVYLDLRKIKLQIEHLESSNVSFIKEIDKINSGLQVIFGSVNSENSLKQETDKNEVINDDPPINDKVYSDNVGDVSDVSDVGDVGHGEVINDNVDVGIVDSLADNENSIDMDLLKDDVLSEIDSDVDDINVDDINVDDINVDINVDDINVDINVDDINVDDKNIYLEMSVKELKDKCIELGLKHSGNKHTLSQRIMDKLD